MTASVKSRTVHGVVEQLAASTPDRDFLFFHEEVFTYARINEAACRVARGFEKLGIGQGDKVAVMMGNRPEFLFTWFGLSKLGAVEVPLNTAHKGDLLSYMLKQSDSVAIVTEPSYLEPLAEVAGEMAGLRSIVVVGPTGEVGAPDTLRSRISLYDDLIDNRGDHTPVEVSPSDPSAIMFTSGTTGPSKGAVIPQNYQLAMAEDICAFAGYSTEDRLYNALPLFHGNAQTLSTMPALLSGASMVLAPRFSASRFWDDISRFGCTEFNYIGGVLAILLKAEPRSDDAENPLRLMMGGGANEAVSEAVQKRFGVQLIECYGMSEIGIAIHSTLSARRPGSCGRVNPSYDVRLVDDDGQELDSDTPGELLVRPNRPNSMMIEYYGMPEKTVEAWRDLWFHTGDFLRSDEDGFFYFVDRKKDALRRRGENISSFEVEQGVNAHPAVQESAAVAARSELGEDEVLICVVLKPGMSLEAEELIAHCEARMAYFMVPRYVRFLDRLPKTPTERVQKFKLREEGVTDDTYDREFSQVRKLEA